MSAPTQTTRPTNPQSMPINQASAGSQTPAPTMAFSTSRRPTSERDPISPAAILGSAPKVPAPQGTTASRPTNGDAESTPEPSAGTTLSPQARPSPSPSDRTPAGSQQGQRATIEDTPPKVGASLADPFLALAADVLDDLEKVRIANENRLRQLTRDEVDADGEERGFGLTEDHPDVARLAALVDMLGDAEHKAVLNLQRLLRQHPLAPWLKAQKGVGEKQAARLLAVIGDPYVRPELTRADGTAEPSRPRTVSELWAYCGYHVTSFPAGQVATDTHRSGVGGDQTGHPDHAGCDTHAGAVGVAPKRQRGQRANWSTLAKTRAYLVSEGIVKASIRKLPEVDDSNGYDFAHREAATDLGQMYLDTRAKYAAAVHKAPCVRCGPKGKPAPAGSPLSDGHKHARAMRAVSKEFLKELWREARRLHIGETGDVS